MAPFDPRAFFDAELDEHERIARATRVLKEGFAAALAASAACIRDGGKILFCGNGGSAADAQHLATELTIRYSRNRAPIAAIALTTDSSALTAGGNDLGFERIFARQVEAIGRAGDVLIAISTSGKSPNILEALRLARQHRLVTIGFTGETGGDMPALCDHLLKVPSRVTARIQEMHIMLGQMLCGALELELGLLPSP